ncbi:hypothetical protein MNBD_GAMMA08-658 [hydrothermal vent metagenome]|uniref:Uncharacterized protein n=1 Tax=hydrothermal vent metagenome TaxID=652676 RepID=A0A3B0WWC0_9ZZZZ
MSSNLPLIPRFFERSILRWADKRQPSTNQKIIIDRRSLYILPTRHGIAYFISSLLILFGSINYENSLGFMLAFLLGSLGFVGMIYTHQNINRLQLKVGRAEPVFCGQTILFPIHISSSEISTHPNLKLQSETGQTVTTHFINETSVDCKLQLTSSQRGYTSPGRIKLFTEYPLGLFHAWSWLTLDSRCLVYPAPDPHHYPLNFSADTQHGTSISDKQGVDDFAGIRQYNEGDLPNHLAWKAIAKTGTLQTKLFNSESAEKIWIMWSHTNETLDIEHRLSILCRMILDASEKNIIYGINIPGSVISPSSGLQHKQRCLKELALFGHFE